MNPEKVFDIRFLASPGIFVLLLYFLLPQEFTNPISQNTPLTWVISVTGILALGFLISSITDFFINLKGRANPDCDENYKHIKDVSGLFTGVDTKNAREIAVWRLFDNMGEGVNVQVHKRWSMAHANFNAFGAIILGWLLAAPVYFFGDVNYVAPWQNCVFVFLMATISALFLIVFWKNGKTAYSSVLKMQKLVSAKFAGDQSDLDTSASPQKSA